MPIPTRSRRRTDVGGPPFRIRFDSLPADMQVLLTDLVRRGFRPDQVIQVWLRPISDHWDEWDDLCNDDRSSGACWSSEDYKKAAEYVVAMARGCQFPPLIIDCLRGLLRDGYHRLYALKALGVTHYPMIPLNQFNPGDCDG